MKKHAKENFYKSLETNLIELNCNDKKGFWKVIKHLIKKNNNFISCFPPLSDKLPNGDKIWHSSPHEKANCLNSYFASISTVNDNNIMFPECQLKNLNQLVIDEITITEVKDIIHSIDISKASGPDNISHRLLKGCIDSVCEPLCILFNRSLSEGFFPESCRKVTVTPLFKTGDKSLPSNYRPVSLLSSCGKILERIIFKYMFMYNFLVANDLLYKYRSGFLPKHSTTYRLVDIYHDTCQGIDHCQLSCIVFLRYF